MPMLERKPVDFFMTENQNIDNPDGSDTAPWKKKDPIAACEKKKKQKLINQEK